MFGVNGNPIILSGNSHPGLALKICEYLELTHKQIKYSLECNLNSRPRYLSLNLWYMIFIKNEDKDNLKQNLLHNIIFYRCINYKGKKILLK